VEEPEQDKPKEEEPKIEVDPNQKASEVLFENEGESKPAEPK